MPARLINPRLERIRALALTVGATMTGPGAGQGGDGGQGSGGQQGGQGTGQGGGQQGGHGSGGQGSGSGGQGGSGAGQSGQGGSDTGSGHGQQGGQGGGQQGGQGGSGGQGNQGGQGGSGNGQVDISTLPQAVQDYIHGLRNENATRRREATEASQGRSTLETAVRQALGLEQAATPEQMQTQLAETQRRERQNAVELAVYRSAGANGGNPDRLLDSRRFMAQVADLDPNAQGFSDQVSQAVQTAVTQDQTLAASAGTSGGAGGGAGMGQGRRNGGTGQNGSGSSVDAGRSLYRERHPQRTPAT